MRSLLLKARSIWRRSTFPYNTSRSLFFSECPPSRPNPKPIAIAIKSSSPAIRAFLYRIRNGLKRTAPLRRLGLPLSPHSLRPPGWLGLLRHLRLQGTPALRASLGSREFAGLLDWPRSLEPLCPCRSGLTSPAPCRFAAKLKKSAAVVSRGGHWLTAKLRAHRADVGALAHSATARLPQRCRDDPRTAQ